MTALPVPGRERWQPLRAGLIDLFYYDVEEFWFHDGRLLLRGNNGTGKSKVLALLLPFLLDGDLSPHRVEPDADPKKRMEWNLLLGGEHPHPERLGYSWLEFGRLGEHGPEFRTIGCGLKAVAGRGIAKHWFFVTDLRIGDELQLVDATHTALPRERLADALAGRGTVHDRARDYRRSVDEALFGLGEQRYGALVDLLVQLRQPQLSKRPSEKALSDALTEALPPLDQAVVADVAEAFRSLEEDRDELAAMREAHASAEGFLGHYRRYASVAARRRAERPRKAEQAYREARAALAAAEGDHRVADAEVADADQRLVELAARADALVAHDRALRESPEMREAGRLEERARAARQQQGAAEQAAADHAAARERVTAHERRLVRAAARAAEAEQEHEAQLHSAAHHADAARLAGRHAEIVGAPLAELADPVPGDPLERAERLLPVLRHDAGELVARQKRSVAHVERLLTAEAGATTVLTAARAEVERLAGVAARLGEQRADAARAVDAEGAALVRAVRAHLDTAVELGVSEPGAVLAALELWVDTLNGPDPARAAVDTAARSAAAELARAGAVLGQAQASAGERAAALAADIERLESGEHSIPPVPHTRGPDAREARPGAPFWRLVDFADHVPHAARAGLEAALEASGLLDAWVDPEGTVRAPDGDVLLVPSAPVASPVSSVLVTGSDAAPGGKVAEDTVAAILAAIGLGEQAGPWIDISGRFRMGVLTGRWRKPAAQYVGRAARENARLARLHELRGDAAELAEHRARIAEEQQALARRRVQLDQEADGLPPDTVLRDAHAAVAALAGQHAALAEQRTAAESALGAAAVAAEEAGEMLRTGAADVDLPADAGGLSAAGRALGAYAEALAGLWPVARAFAQAVATRMEAADDLDRERAAHQAARERAADAERAARISAEEHATLLATVGDAVEELQAKLAAVAAATDENQRAQQATQRQHTVAVAARGRADGLRDAATSTLERATQERVDAADSMRRFAATGLLAVALPALELPAPDASWAPDPTVRLARQIDQELDSTAAEDPIWIRVQRTVTEELKTLTDTLARQGNRASAQLLEDGIVVEITFRGRPATVPELAGALGSEVADRTRLLDEREREILENHLVNEVASTLQELITEAERQVRMMNSELDARPTSTGMRLRLEWRPREDGPPGLAEARRRLLRQSSDAWSADDRAAVGEFLQDRIAEMRSRDETGTWLEHLSSALDYRGWHQFVIERHQNGQWRPATGPASGGERVLAASVPLFAAASAHYASAGNPHAPRLVTLDEAFAGVDDNARAKYLGLLAAFDLDVVMTSEREWGCYAEVPGLAIAQLARTDGVAAVLVSNWRWDGEQRRAMPRPVTAAAGLQPVAAAAEGGLF